MGCRWVGGFLRIMPRGSILLRIQDGAMYGKSRMYVSKKFCFKTRAHFSWTYITWTFVSNTLDHLCFCFSGLWEYILGVPYGGVYTVSRLGGVVPVQLLVSGGARSDAGQ